MYKKLLTSADRTEIGFYQGVLESEGIQCLVKNEFLAGAMGELPVNETWPELWVEELELSRANLILEDLKPTKGGDAWQCQNCGEWIEAQFSDCWRCSQTAKSD